MKVRLQDVVDGILYANAETQFYYHTESESVVIMRILMHIRISICRFPMSMKWTRQR